jgi:hypothetical protein
MKPMPMALAVALLGAIPAKAVECEFRNGLCGATLIDAGWQVLARCHDGHAWAQVLAKGDERLVCEGINAYDGPTEFRCRPFRGDLDRFKLDAAKAPDEFVRTRTSCWGTSQQSGGVR